MKNWAKSVKAKVFYNATLTPSELEDLKIL
jgi:hypothetical protein